MLKKKLSKQKILQKQRIEDKKCDKAWAKGIRENANGICELCGSSTQFLQSHHLLCCRHRPTRWLMLNGVALCPRCHKFGAYSVHRNPIYAIERFREIRGEKWYQQVKWLAFSVE